MTRPLRALLALLGLAVALVAGCVGNPVPLPPTFGPVDPTKVGGSTQETTGATLVSGFADASDPGAEVLGWNLEQLGPAVGAAVAEDGSFELPLAYTHGDELRLVTAHPGGAVEGRAEPTDVIAAVGAFTTPDRPACVMLDAHLALDATRAGVVEIVNACGEEITLDSVALRNGEASFEITGGVRATIPDGARAEIGVRALGDSELEDILFVHISARGSPRRYAVSLTVSARD